MRAIDRHPQLARRWRSLLDHLAQHPSPALSWVHARINQRAALVARWRSVQVDGQVLEVRSGYDCDCTSYLSRRLVPVPVSALLWQVEENHRREWLDGPEEVSWEYPLAAREGHWSRDNALEAFEDGHPARVEIRPPLET